MTDHRDVAASWLRGLAARGVRVSLRNNRLEMHPPHAYKRLTDAEVLVLRHHRASIKALVEEGIPLDVASPSAVVAPTPAPPPPPCQWCGQHPCIGESHPAFWSLHPEAARRRDAAQFRRNFGLPPAEGDEPPPRVPTDEERRQAEVRRKLGHTGVLNESTGLRRHWE